jgi:hypothetical protein
VRTGELAADLLYAAAGLGATGDAVALRHAFEQRHLARAFAYFSDDQQSRNRRAAQPALAVRREVAAVSSRLLGG